MSEETNNIEESKKKLVGEYVIKPKTNNFPYKYKLYKKVYDEYGTTLIFVSYHITLAGAKREAKKLSKDSLLKRTNINIDVYTDEHNKLIVEQKGK